MMDDRERLKFDTQPIKLRIESEPYVRFVGKKYAASLNVYDVKSKREYYIIIDAQSLSQPLHEIAMKENGLKHLEMWISKESDDKYARYEISLT